MMTSYHGDTSRNNDPLWGESISNWWFPLTINGQWYKALMIYVVGLNKLVSEQQQKIVDRTGQGYLFWNSLLVLKTKNLVRYLFVLQKCCFVPNNALTCRHTIYNFSPLPTFKLNGIAYLWTYNQNEYMCKVFTWPYHCHRSTSK